MLPTSIYDYTSTQEFLLATFKNKQKVNPRFSLRAWSRQLGLPNPMVLSRIFRGQARLQPHLARQIANRIGIPAEDQKFFELLSLYEIADTPEQKELYEDLLLAIKPQLDLTSLETDGFRVISDWHYFPILEMTLLKEFKSDPVWISERLGHGITPEMVRIAIERLIRLGLMKREPNGQLKKLPKGRVWAGDKGAEQAVRLYHAQMMRKAEQVIEAQSLNERSFSSVTLPVKKKDLEKLKKLIERLNKSASRCASAPGDAEEIYHLNVQLFRATEKKGTK